MGLLCFIKKKLKPYKPLLNIVSKHTTMTFYTKSQIQSQYNYAMKVKSASDLALYFHHNQKQFSVMNKQELGFQMKEWRKLVKKGELTIRLANNKTKQVDDKDWHLLVIQPKDDDKLADYSVDLFGALLLGFHVNGYIYAFDNIKNRDMIYEYVMKDFKE